MNTAEISLNNSIDLADFQLRCLEILEQLAPLGHLELQEQPALQEHLEILEQLALLALLVQPEHPERLEVLQALLDHLELQEQLVRLEIQGLRVHLLFQ